MRASSRQPRNGPVAGSLSFHPVTRSSISPRPRTISAHSLALGCHDVPVSAWDVKMEKLAVHVERFDAEAESYL